MKMKNLWKSISTFAFAMVLVMVVLPAFTVKAAEPTEDDVVAVTVNGTTTYYEDFTTAMETIAAAGGMSGEVTLKLLKDAEWDLVYNPSRNYWPKGNYILDLNGCSLTFGTLVALGNNTEVVVKDGIGNGIINSAISIYEGGKLTLQSGTIQYSYDVIYMHDGATFDMTGGTLISTVNANVIYAEFYSDITTINISGGILDGLPFIITDNSRLANITLTGGIYKRGIITGGDYTSEGIYMSDIIPWNYLVKNENGDIIDLDANKYGVLEYIQVVRISPDICPHSYGNTSEANCKEKAICKGCGGSYGELGDHIPDVNTGHCVVDGCDEKNVAKISMSYDGVTQYYNDFLSVYYAADRIEGDGLIKIKVLTNIEDSDYELPFPAKNIEFDLNGKSLICNIINLFDGCNLTLINSIGSEGKISIEDKVFVNEDARLTIDGVTIEFNASCSWVEVYGVFIMTGGKLINKGADEIVIYVLDAEYLKGIYISGGEISKMDLGLVCEEEYGDKISLSGGKYDKIGIYASYINHYASYYREALAAGCSYRYTETGEIIENISNYTYELQNVEIVCSHIASHQTYEAVEDDRTIIISCGVCGKEVGRITLEDVEDIIYSATASVEAEVTGDIDKIPNYTIRYTGNGYDSENAPTAAGEYTVTLTVASTDGDISVSDTFVIKPITLVDGMVAMQPLEGDYNGTSYAPQIVVSDNGNVLVKDVDYTIAWDKTDIVDADTYTVTITGKGNYTGTVTKTFKVNAVSLRDVKVEQTGTLIYNGTALTPIVTANAIVVNGQVITYKYRATENESYGAMPTYIDAGTYTVYFIATAENHKEYEGSFTVVIEKASKEVPGVTKKDETIDGKNDGAITDVDNTMEYRKEGETTYKSVEGTSIANLADGKYYVRYKETANYKASADKEVVIAAGEEVIVPPTTEEVLEENKWYESTKDTTASNVTVEDETNLKNAKETFEKMLKENSDEYTEETKSAIEEEIKRIESSLKVIENVKAVEELINKLPETVTKEDEEAIKAAITAYNALSASERKLLAGKFVTMLEAAKAELDKLNESEEDGKEEESEKETEGETGEEDKPTDTGDMTNVWMWFVMIFVSGIVAFSMNHKKREEM